MTDLSSQDIKFARMAVHLGYCDEKSAQKAGRIVMNFLKRAPDAAPSIARVMVQKGYLNKEQAEIVLKRLAAGKSTGIVTIASSKPRKSGGVIKDIPGYKLIKIIRHEPNVVVYLANQLSMERLVALKILDEDLSKDFTLIRRFLREAKAAGRLNHPNVIRVHEVGNAGSTYYYNTEYVDGYSLQEWMHQNSSQHLSPESICNIFSQVANALDYGVSNRVIHREIRPDNIYIGKNEVAKIANLGLVNDEEKRFLKGMNAHFVAPEQVEKKKVTGRVDLYSMGAVMYYALSNHPPFSGRTPHEILTRRLIHPPVPLNKLTNNVPETLLDLIDVLMALHPGDRPDSPGIVMEELHRMEEGDFSGSEWLHSMKKRNKSNGKRSSSSSPRNIRRSKRGR